MIRFLETSLHIKKNLIRRIKEAYSPKSLKLIKNKKQLILFKKYSNDYKRTRATELSY